MSETTPLTIAKALIAAENKGDVDAACALFAPDAVADLAMGERHDTPDAIRQWQQVLANEHFFMHTENIDVQADTVFVYGTFLLDRLRAQNKPALDARWTITVRGDKVTRFDVKLMLEKPR